MTSTHTTLSLALLRQGLTVSVELSHQDPTSQAAIAPVRAAVALDLEALRALQLEPDAYGRALAAQLFAGEAVQARFLQVERASEAAGHLLRISLRIDPSAQDLHGLRWELLRHPASGAALATMERTLFSRFMVSTDWRPVRLRARAELRAVVAVSAPPAEELARAQLAPVDLAGEVGRAKAALAGVPVTVLGEPGAPCTLEALVEAARDTDLLYVVGHGAFARSTGMPSLFLQDDSGRLKVVKGDELATRLGELLQGPRLVVLASCQSAGDGAQVDPEQRGSVSSTLAARLADAGVPAVLAMQGQVRMDTVERLMPVFFTELLRDGQIDRALAVARGAVRSQPDHWMPVLFLRLNSGRIWYTPGFGGDNGPETWKRLVKPVQQGKVVPLVGPGMNEHICGTSFTVARHMAEKVGFPLAPYEWDDLPRVTQFLSVKESRFNVVSAYQDQLVEDMRWMHRASLGADGLRGARLGPLLAQVCKQVREHDPDEPFRLLAELPARVYLTTNFDPVLSTALTDAGRAPNRVITRWRHRRSPELAGPRMDEPTHEAPIVFHALGAFSKEGDDSLVMTEDDYFDYLIATSADRLMPPEVESALVDNSLLLLGFRLTDWSFRVLFRLIMSLPGRERLKRYCHVAVQVDPDLHEMADLEGAKAYLTRYFGSEANIDLYWGTPREFLAQLRDELRRSDAPAAEEAAVDDAWDF